jgi:hypothetical protein
MNRQQGEFGLVLCLSFLSELRLSGLSLFKILCTLNGPYYVLENKQIHFIVSGFVMHSTTKTDKYFCKRRYH